MMHMWSSEAADRMIDDAMVKEQMTYITLHIKLKIEQYEFS